MKKLAIVLCFFGVATHAQKAFFGGFGNMVVYNQGTHSVSNTICCGNRVYVTTSNDGSTVFTSQFNKPMYYIDAVNETVVDSLPLSFYDLTSADSTNMIFGAHRDSNKIFVIDPALKSYTALNVNAPYYLTRRPGRKEVWFTSNNSYGVLNYSSGYNITMHSYTNASLPIDEIRFTPDGSTVLLANVGTSRIYKINANTQMVTDSVFVPNLWGVEADGSGTKFFSSSMNKKIFKHSLSTMGTIDSVATPLLPFFLYLTPDQSELWAIYHDDDSLGVFNSGTLSQITTSHISPSPFIVTFSNAVTGMTELVDREILVYPNPSSGVFNLAAPTEIISVQVTNSLGEVIWSHADGSAACKVNLQDAPHGIYFYRMQCIGNKFYSGKLIVNP